MRRDSRAVGDQILTFPSHDDEAKMFLSTRFQESEKTSRVCSRHWRIGKSFKVASKSFMEPSPLAAASWFAFDSLKATSKRESCVSNLHGGVSGR